MEWITDIKNGYDVLEVFMECGYMFVSSTGRNHAKMAAFSFNKDFQTWHLIGWQHNRQPIRSHVRKSLLTNVEFNIDFSHPVPLIIKKCRQCHYVCMYFWSLYVEETKYVGSEFNIEHNISHKTRGFVVRCSNLINIDNIMICWRCIYTYSS